jgi:hypothetical protein
MTGHSPVQIRLIFRLVPPHSHGQFPVSNMFLAYVQRFDIVPQYASLATTNARGIYPDPVTKMYIVKRSLRADGSRMGDVIPVTNLRASADLIPLFRNQADKRLTKENNLECNQEFLLNKFFDPNLFYSIEKL